MCALVIGVQTFALPIYRARGVAFDTSVQHVEQAVRLADAQRRSHGQRPGNAREHPIDGEVQRIEEFGHRGRVRSGALRAGVERRSADGAVGRGYAPDASASTMTRASCGGAGRRGRSEEQTSELQSIMRISYSVFCL